MFLYSHWIMTRALPEDYSTRFETVRIYIAGPVKFERELFRPWRPITPRHLQITEMPLEGSSIFYINPTNTSSSRPYLKAFVPVAVSKKIQLGELEYKPIVDIFGDMGGFYGYGKYAYVDLRYEQDEQDFCTYSIAEPHSVPMTVASHIADIELLTGVEQGYGYEQVSPDVYHITASPSPHPDALRERMRFEPYRQQQGDLELRRCSTCEGPLAIGDNQWYPDRGIIVNRLTGRRMALFGNAQLDPVFDELEAELGDTVPRAVVEAQRRFTKSGFYTLDDITNEEDFRGRLALRGMGNLKELEMRRKGLRMRMENVALPLILMGLAQGFYEIGFGVDATDIDWELSKEGNLEMEVEPLQLAGSRDA